ncbi:MAG TPA: NAD(P)-binding domain-containing protein [Actinomycetota bacterium]|nr:NAD(P)-binding domain-containing protein [Actinomycetota bacterium]
MATVDKPFPPGTYPVVVVGSGPGALQTSYTLRSLGVEHAVISSDDRPAGMFQRFPIFQRLISWSKPYSPVERHSRAYERYDWNSLLADEPDSCGLVTDQMDGTSYFPARQEMEAGIAAFAEKTKLTIRYGCTWESTRKDGDDFVLTTSDGEYRCRIPIFAIGMAMSWVPNIPGIDEVPHYVDVKTPRDYAGKRVAIIGKRNSGFELADGLLPWARQIVLLSPRPTGVSVLTHFVASVRARYLQPYEDHVLGGGNFIVDAAIERIERTSDGWRVHAQGTTKPGPMTVEADEVIAATGFQVPMQDLRDLGVATFMQDRFPALTPMWESASVPGIHFAGTTTQGAVGLRKYGIGSSSAAVHGFRYNARIMARHIAEKHFGVTIDRPSIAPEDIVEKLLDEATLAPELWTQKSYLCRVFESRDGGFVDGDVLPLQAFVDGSGPDGTAITIETDAEGDIHPALYVRAKGSVEEHLLDSTSMHDYRDPEHRAQVKAALGPLGL